MNRRPLSSFPAPAYPVARRVLFAAGLLSLGTLLGCDSPTEPERPVATTEPAPAEQEVITTDLEAALAKPGLEGEAVDTSPAPDPIIGDVAVPAEPNGPSQDHTILPVMRVSGQVAIGTLDLLADHEVVGNVIHKYRGQIRACYEQRLKQNPDLQGRIEIVWTINDGRITSASVEANTTGDSALADCILPRLKRWRFPIDLEPDLEVYCPFILSPGPGTPAPDKEVPL